VGICHCLACQRRTGSDFAALASFAAPFMKRANVREGCRPPGAGWPNTRVHAEGDTSCWTCLINSRIASCAHGLPERRAQKIPAPATVGRRVTLVVRLCSCV
jgi:hypothetical protein